jgi:hypothetical protein
MIPSSANRKSANVPVVSEIPHKTAKPTSVESLKSENSTEASNSMSKSSK